MTKISRKRKPVYKTAPESNYKRRVYTSHWTLEAKTDFVPSCFSWCKECRNRKSHTFCRKGCRRCQKNVWCQGNTMRLVDKNELINYFIEKTEDVDLEEDSEDDESSYSSYEEEDDDECSCSSSDSVTLVCDPKTQKCHYKKVK